jgi:plastocyanin
MQPRLRTLTLGVAVASSIAVLATGCGSSDDNSKASDSQTKEKTTAQAPASGTGSTLALAADPNKIAFDKKSLSAKAGKTTIAFDNPAQIPHAVEVEGNGVEKKTKVIQKAKATLALNLKPGTYEFYCPVADHKAEGMKGTLVVK